MKDSRLFLTLLRALELWPSSPSRALFKSQDAVLFRSDDVRSPCIDLGCGNGKFAVVADWSITFGIDKAEPVLRRAAATGRYQQVVRGELENLPFCTGSFSTAVSNSTFEHVLDVYRVAAETYRVLVPGGHFTFTVPLREKREWLYFARRAEELGEEKIAESYREEFDRRWKHRQYFTVTGLSTILTQVGFSSLTFQLYESCDTSALIDILCNFELTRWHHPNTEVNQFVEKELRAYFATTLAECATKSGEDEGANVIIRAQR